MSQESLVARARSLPDGSHELLAPAVGWYSQAPERAVLLQARERLGLLRILGRPVAILVPDGARGLVVSEPPLLRRLPVEFGQTLCRLQPFAADGAEGALAAAADPRAQPESGGSILRANQAGRFWRRPQPGAAEFLAEGAVAEAGQTLGLLEVMKTFQPLRFQSGSGMPERARLRRWRVEDGAEVAEGAPLAEFEPA